MKPSVVSTVPPPCHWMEWNPTSWNPTHCAPAVGDGSNASSRSLTQARLFNWFCLQFSSFLLPCGGIAYFVKQDNLRLHWQLPNSLLKPTDLFLTNFSAYSIQQNPHQWMRKQESLTAFNNIFLFQPSIFWVLLLQLLDFCLVLLFGEQDYFWAEPPHVGPPCISVPPANSISQVESHPFKNHNEYFIDLGTVFEGLPNTQRGHLMEMHTYAFLLGNDTEMSYWAQRVFHMI